MANLTITAASVAIGSTETKTVRRTAGESITQGQPYYISTSDSKAYRADNNDGSAKAEVAGVALTPAATNGDFIGIELGPMIIGATVAIGTSYVVSSTVGLIAVEADITSGQYVSYVGYGISTSQIYVDPKPTGLTKA